MFVKLFLFSEYGDRNNEGQWGNDSTGLSGVDAGVPSYGDSCSGSGYEQLETRSDSQWNLDN
jgi:hypothetical protein